MKILSTKTFLFQNGEDEFKIQAHEISSDAPDWIAKTTLFQLAQKDGSISEITTKEQQVAAENTGTTAEDAESSTKGSKGK